MDMEQFLAMTLSLLYRNLENYSLFKKPLAEVVDQQQKLSGRHNYSHLFLYF
jgi:hypothetical protein